MLSLFQSADPLLMLSNSLVICPFSLLSSYISNQWSFIQGGGFLCFLTFLSTLILGTDIIYKLFKYFNWHSRILNFPSFLTGILKNHNFYCMYICSSLFNNHRDHFIVSPTYFTFLLHIYNHFPSFRIIIKRSSPPNAFSLWINKIIISWKKLSYPLTSFLTDA